MTNSRLPRLPLTALAVLLPFAAAACSRASQPVAPSRAADPASSSTPSAAPPMEAPGDQAGLEDRMVLATSKAIRRANLTTLRDECLAYNFDPHAFPDAYLVEIRENHRHRGCAGDPQTQPRLFSVKIDKATEKMWTDQGTPGKFHALPSAPR